MNLLDALDEELARLGSNPERFRELACRLFAYGIVVRDEDAVEQRLYDDIRRLEGVLSDYFAASGFRLHHNVQATYFRLYAPGADIPGIDDDELAPVPALRAKVSADFVAAALGLRFLYQQALYEGADKLTDEGEVLIRFDELASILQTQLKRPLPEGLGERDRLLKELKRHRLIQFSSTFSMADEDALIAIRQTILGVVSEEALAPFLASGDEAAVVETEESEEAVAAGEDDEA